MKKFFASLAITLFTVLFIAVANKHLRASQETKPVQTVKISGGTAQATFNVQSSPALITIDADNKIESVSTTAGSAQPLSLDVWLVNNISPGKITLTAKSESATTVTFSLTEISQITAQSHSHTSQNIPATQTSPQVTEVEAGSIPEFTTKLRNGSIVFSFNHPLFTADSEPYRVTVIAQSNQGELTLQSNGNNPVPEFILPAGAVISKIKEVRIKQLNSEKPTQVLK